MSQPPWGDEQPTAALPVIGRPEPGPPEFGRPEFGPPEFGPPEFGPPEFGPPEPGPDPGRPEFGHPEPGPDPGPPQPVPPPDPVPAPEPPHETVQAVPAGVQQRASDRPPPSWPLPVDPDRTWHLPAPPNLHRAAHEANWPPTPGQRQWQPEPDHPEGWQPQHERHLDGQDGAPPGQPAALPATAPAAPRPRRTVLWVSAALALTVLLCGGGAFSAFLLLRNANNTGGAPDPTTAVTRFLSAVYAEQDADAANDLVCKEARDAKKVAAKVDEIRGYARQYDAPQFRWADPSVAAQTDDRATVAVGVTMTTRDEKTALQKLTFTVVRSTGWWVCEVAG